MRDLGAWLKSCWQKLGLKGEPHLRQVEIEYCIIFPVAFCGAGTWQRNSECGGIYRKHTWLTPFNWKEGNCLRRFSHASYTRQRSHFMSAPMLHRWKVCKMRQTCELRALLKDYIRKYLFHLCDIIGLGGTWETVPTIWWGQVRKDRKKISLV